MAEQTKKPYWVPLNTGLASRFPVDRPFSEIEAAFSLQLNLLRKNNVSVTGLAKSWGWTRKRTTLFLERIGAVIEYPDQTAKKQNQRGQIRGKILQNEGTDKGQIMLIDFNMLDAERARSGTDNEKTGDRSGATIKTYKHTTNNNTSSSNIDEGSEPYRLAELLFSLIQKQSQKFKQPDLKKWAAHIDRAIRIDGRTPSDIEKVIRWAQADPFWQSNILSTAKLREKFDQLTIKMNSNQGENRGKRYDNFTGKRYQDQGLDKDWLES
jgi:hypothetical protein